MKKYLLRLLKKEKQSAIVGLQTAVRYLKRDPNNDFWLRRKQSAENNLKKVEGYISKLDKLFEIVK